MADLFSKSLTTINMKTSNFLEEKKIQTYIAKLNADVEIIEKEIGKMVYTAWANGQDVSEELIAAQLSEISKKKQTILEQKEAASELARKEVEILGKGDVAKAHAVYCPNCGHGYDTPVKFCRCCGTKME